MNIFRRIWAVPLSAEFFNLSKNIYNLSVDSNRFTL